MKQFFLLLFCYLLAEPVFAWIFVQASSVNNRYVKLLSLFLYLFMLLRYKSLRPVEKVCVAVFSLLMMKLALQSVFSYGSLFRHFELYTVLFPVIFVLFCKQLLMRLNIDLLALTANFYLLTYVVFMALFGQGFSLDLRAVSMTDYGPFSGDTRIVHAQSLYMLLLPFLWYLHRYVATEKAKYLLGFFFCFGVLVLHQHRSVWSSTIVATAAYFFMMLRSRPKAVAPVLKVAGITLAVTVLVLATAARFYPGLAGYLAERFADILHPGRTEGTGSFRISQFWTYFNYFVQKPVFGCGFEGYELKNPLVDWWPPNTGHHFHNGYIEMLFYHGLIGLVLKYAFLVYIFMRSFRRRLPEPFIVLAAFCISGFVFSLCYVLPLMFWAQVGLCLHYAENRRQE